jgi:hypothetical protein
VRKNNLFYILIISTFFAVLLFNPNLRPNVWDSYEYLNVGKSLAQGRGYLEIWNPEEPLFWRSVGYPFLLSVLMRLSDDIIYLKCFSLVCYIANILLIYYLFLKIFRLPDIIIFILSLITSSTPIAIWPYALPKLYVRNLKNNEEEEVVFSDEKIWSPSVSEMQKETNTDNIYIRAKFGQKVDLPP